MQNELPLEAKQPPSWAQSAAVASLPAAGGMGGSGAGRKKPRVAIQCHHCKAVFFVVQAKAALRKYCSMACYYNKTPLERFWAFVDKRGPDECWPWKGSGKRDGRGDFWDGDRQVIASRFSYELHKGKIGDGLEICHSCDNPPCVNPAHLFEGTHTVNMQDMVGKGRSSTGEHHSKAKLTHEQVLSIRSEYIKGKHGFGSVSLGRKYGVSAQSILQILRGNHWKHTGGEICV